jgi:hypothetical protein
LKLILLKRRESFTTLILVGCNFLFHFACVFYCKNCYFFA